MLSLRDVTLCCIDTANHALALQALVRSRAGTAFGRSLFLTHALPPDIAVPAGIEVVDIGPLASREGYSHFVLKDLLPHVSTSHVLLVQWDGFVVNPGAWDDAFLGCDYLGAKWFWHDDGMRVGNGGFSLRSHRLLEALGDPRIVLDGAEDTTIGRTFRPLLEREHGIHFGSEALADRFSFEAAYPIGTPFGFHGLYNFCRTLPPAEIAAMAPTFSEAIARSPQLAQLLRNCVAMGQWPAAQAIAARILATDPAAPEALAILETARAHASQPAQVGRNAPCPCGSGRKFKQCHGALGSAPAAAALPAPSVDAVLQDALAAHQRGDLVTAETGYARALSQEPDHPLAEHYLGVVHYQRRQFDQALPLLERAVHARPQEPEFHNNLGLALAAIDRNDDAIATYRRAIELKPDHAVAWNNLGLALTAANRLADATTAYREALRHAPHFAHARWNLALALLAQGNYAEGWKAYESRLELAELGGRTAPSVLPRWDGSLRRPRDLLLVAEQGLGDAIQFVRFAEPLARAGMRVLLQVPRALVTLAATAPGVSGVAALEASAPGGEVALPLLSVAAALGIDATRIPQRVPYLRADDLRRGRARALLAETGGRLRVGLVWAGAARHSNDSRRSMPFANLRRLVDMPDVTWVSLQKDVAVGPPLIELDLRNDLDDNAALITELDLVLCVDTGIAHLAAALGRPTWIMLPFAPDWRWQVDRMDSAWYPTARLFRQPSPGDWGSVLEAVRIALRERIEARAAR